MSALNRYDVLKEITGTALSGATLKDAGAASTSTELVRGQKINLNYFAPGQTASNDGQFKQELTPESKRRLASAQTRARYTPRQAMHMALSQISDPRYAPKVDRGVSSELRAQARDWVRTNNLMMRQKMGRASVVDPLMRRGRELVGKIGENAFNKIDPNHELRLSLAQGKLDKQSKKDKRFSADAILKRIQGAQPATARPTSTRSLSASQMKNPYALLNAMAPKMAQAPGATLARTAVAAIGWAVSHAEADMGGPSRPSPKIGRGRDLRPQVA